MPVTDVDICSRALIRLGAKPISSLEAPENDPGKTCANTYPSVKLAVLSSYPWRATMVKARLNRLTDLPKNEYKYKYQLPVVRMGGPRAVFSSGGENSPLLKKFEIFGEELLANTEQVWIDYQIEISEQNMPPYLQELLVLALAAEIAFPVTDKATVMNLFQKKAFGTPQENGQGGYFRIAKRIDAQQQPPQVVEDFSLIDVRY